MTAIKGFGPLKRESFENPSSSTQLRHLDPDAKKRMSNNENVKQWRIDWHTLLHGSFVVQSGVYRSTRSATLRQFRRGLGFDRLLGQRTPLKCKVQ